jgi:methyl-CpG-binding domain protein 4
LHSYLSIARQLKLARQGECNAQPDAAPSSAAAPPPASDEKKRAAPPPASDEKRRAREISCALVLAQEGRDRELEPELRRLGYTHRLAPLVLAYAPEYHALRAAAIETDAVPPCGRVCALDGTLSPEFLAHMQGALGADARFWHETGYLDGDLGYFSYVHPLASCAHSRAQSGAQGRAGSGAPTAAIDGPSAMDQLIGLIADLITPSFPGVARARYAEWWAHNRPHGGGHQLHFDSDNEGDDGVRNPIASTVLFLSAAGGPTLVTEQELSSRALASHGWLAYPRENRLVAFDGRLAHAVIPGRAAFQTERRRVTVMIAFWDSIRTRDLQGGGHSLGPARSFIRPGDAGSPAWSTQFAPFGGELAACAQSREAHIVPVRPVWRELGPAQDPGGGELGAARAGARSAGALPAYDELFQGL